MEPLGRKYDSIEGVIKCYLIAVISLMFLGFPIALFIPVGYGYNIFNFFFPAFLFCSGLSAVLLLMLRRAEKFGIVEKSFFGIFISLMLAALINGTPGAEFLKYSGIVLIPVTVALCYKSLPAFTVKATCVGISLLWFVNVLHCLHKFPAVNNVGITGNQNWLSAVILAGIPIAVFQLKILLQKYVSKENICWLISGIFVLAPSIPILLKADSRASLVALLVLPLFIVFNLGSKKVKLIIACLSILGISLLPILFEKQLERENRRNVRVPMWSSTVKMIIKNPLGVGPENFEARYPEYASEAQKRMLVAAETTAHPHNEFLHVSAMGGVAAGICWIIIVGFALFYKFSNKELFLFKAPLFILFIQGMMDKPLYQMPTMLLFYLLLGLVLGQKELISFNLKKPQREKASLYKIISAALVLAFSYFALMISSSSWYERKAMIAEQGNDKETALELYKKSHNYALWRLMPAYKAFIISSVDLPNPAEAIDFYSALESRAPDFRQFNLLKGKFFIDLAIQDRELAQEHLQTAWESYNRACDLNVTNILSFIDRMKFAARFSSGEKLEESYKALKDVYKYKAHAGAEEIRVDLKIWGQGWKKNEKYSEFLNYVNLFILRLKPAFVVSDLYPKKYRQLLPMFSERYSIADMVYATDSYLLMEELPTGDFRSKVDYINREVSINQDSFSWPRQTLKNRSGSKKSKLCLLAMAGRIHGYEAIIHLETDSVFLIKENAFYLIDGEGFRQLTNDSGASYIKGKTFLYFDYPQAFFYKNELLAHVLSEAGATPQYCRNPDYVLSKFIHLFPEKPIKISIMNEPFEAILNKMQKKSQ